LGFAGTVCLESRWESVIGSWGCRDVNVAWRDDWVYL
jgi:hypothetical protein